MTYLRAQGPRFLTVHDRGGVKFVKVACACKKCTLRTTSDFKLKFTITIIITITQIQNINFEQILVVTFEFTGAARGFMIKSCAARGVKKVGQHWFTSRIGVW